MEAARSARAPCSCAKTTITWRGHTNATAALVTLPGLQHRGATEDAHDFIADEETDAEAIKKMLERYAARTKPPGK
jgi:hypothetical protein